MWPLLLVFLGYNIQTAVDGFDFSPNCVQGRAAIVQLMEWRWDDIARECETFLGPYGYCGVQISPPNENVVVTDPFRPWWERYQSVSYHLTTRSGNESQLRDMIERCNRVGVQVYPDAVINHMTGAGYSGVGTGGCTFDAHEDKLLFPCVPYGPGDFNGRDMCYTGDLNIHNYQNAQEVRNCRLAGEVSLVDLRLSAEYVRGKVVDYLNHLISLGVAGFRIDAAKHMWPADLKLIFDNLTDLRSDMHGEHKRAFIFQEIPADPTEAVKVSEYTWLGKVSNRRMGPMLSTVFRHQNPMKYLSNWGEGWSLMPGLDSLNFMDNHDSQRFSWNPVVTYREPKQYKMANAFMLAHPYGFPRVMSSYLYREDWEGPPHEAGGSIKHVIVNDDLTCGNGWVCEHRWRQIYNMVAFRNLAAFAPLTNWVAPHDYQIAFSRDQKGFIAFNLESFPFRSWVQTSLPGGVYCDVITGNLENGACTGLSVTVQGDGRAHIDVCNDCDDPMVAIHIGAKVGSPPRRHYG